MDILNFSLIEGDKMAVVHCPTEEGAKQFLKCLREKFPSKRFITGTHWDFYKESTCYWPNFGCIEGLQYGSLEYAMKHRYKVIEFSELCAVVDLPINDYDVDIKSLFGME